MKKFYKSIVVATLAVLALTGCGNSDKSTKKKKISDVAGVTYKVAMDSDYPPYEFIGEQGIATGFEVELLQAIANDQNVKLTFIPTPWNVLMKGLKNKDYDMIIGGISEADIEDEGYETDDFLLPKSHVYAQDTIVTLTKNESSAPKTFQQLKGHKVVTVGDTSWVTELREVVRDDNIIGEKTSFLALQALIQGKADVMLNEKGVMKHYQHTIPEFPLTLYSQDKYFKPYEVVGVINKDKEELVDVFNKGLKNIIRSGQYKKIYRKWFAEEPIKLPKT